MVKALDNHFSYILPEWTLATSLTFIGVGTFKACRDIDRVWLTNELLLLETNLDFVSPVKIIAVSADRAKHSNSHDRPP